MKETGAGLSSTPQALSDSMEPRIPSILRASKGGVVILTKQLALDYAKDNIRVNCVCPGFIDTPMNEKVRGAQREAILRRQPLGRAGRLKRSPAALFLASDESSFTTGSALMVDGGQLAGRAESGAAR